MEWFNSSHRRVEANELARARMDEPQARSLQAALRLLSQVARDDEWMRANDGQRMLDHALWILVELTTPKGKDYVR